MKNTLKLNKNSQNYKDIQTITVDKFTLYHKNISQKLIESSAVDILPSIKIIYALAYESKIKVTLKGVITVKSKKNLDEKLSINQYNYTWLLHILTLFGYLSSKQIKTPLSKFIALMQKDDGESIKTIFSDYLNLNEQHEFLFAPFATTIVHGNPITTFRKTLFRVIKAQNSTEWISIDSIVDSIDINAKTLKFMKNGAINAYGFTDSFSRYRYNKIEDLKVVVRYFVKAFVGILNRLGLFNLGQTPLISYAKEDLNSILKQYEIVFMNIEYFKFSDLGKYVFEIKDSFQSKDDFSLILNPYALEIKVDKKNKLSDIFLENTTTKVDDLKYKTDIKTFMQKIDTLAQYESMKKLFLKKCGNVPKNWIDFFMILEERTNGASVVCQNAILIKLKNNKELLKIIAGHEKLKSKILKADHLHLVVLKHDLSYVKKTLREYGILI